MKHIFPKPGKGTASRRPPVEIIQRPLFWTCTYCDKEFRLYGGGIPVRCPSCGGRRDLKSDDYKSVERTGRFYRCPYCRQGIEMISGSEPAACPACGRDIEPGTA